MSKPHNQVFDSGQMTQIQAIAWLFAFYYQPNDHVKLCRFWRRHGVNDKQPLRPDCVDFSIVQHDHFTPHGTGESSLALS